MKVKVKAPDFYDEMTSICCVHKT